MPENPPARWSGATFTSDVSHVDEILKTEANPRPSEEEAIPSAAIVAQITALVAAERHAPARAGPESRVGTANGVVLKLCRRAHCRYRPNFPQSRRPRAWIRNRRLPDRAAGIFGAVRTRERASPCATRQSPKVTAESDEIAARSGDGPACRCSVDRVRCRRKSRIVFIVLMSEVAVIVPGKHWSLVNPCSC